MIELNKEKRAIFESLTDKDIMSNKCKNYISVTDVKTMLSSPFDGDTIAQGLVDKYYDMPSSKYYHMSKEQILESWSQKGQISMQYGRLLDECAEQLLEVRDEDEYEMFLMDNNYDDDDRFKGNVDAMQEFIETITKSGDVEYIGREIPVCYHIDNKIKPDEADNGYYLKGRIDALFYNKRTNKYIIIDWKSDEKIYTEPDKWSKPCLGPGAGHYQISWVLYTYQLYSYKMALLQNWLKDIEPDNIDVYICNCPHKPYKDEHAIYKDKKFVLLPPAFKYNSEKLNKAYLFAIKKKLLMLKKDKNK